MTSKLTQDDFMSHNPSHDFIMEIIASRVCQIMSEGALLTAGQQRNPFSIQFQTKPSWSWEDKAKSSGTRLGLGATSWCNTGHSSLCRGGWCS